MSGFEALLEVQEASYRSADRALRASWPQERTMDRAELEAFLDARLYCVLATTAAQGRAQARPVGFTVSGGSFWFATVTGGRLRNLRQKPWASVVISEGEGDEHRGLVADGPVSIVGEPPDHVARAWEARMGSRPDWAEAWLELRPARLFSYRRA